MPRMSITDGTFGRKNPGNHPSTTSIHPTMTKYSDVFYGPNVTDHGLPRNPFKSCVVPRDLIGWISTPQPRRCSKSRPVLPRDNGTIPNNSYSQFQNVTYDPPYVMIAGCSKLD